MKAELLVSSDQKGITTTTTNTMSSSSPDTNDLGLTLRNGNGRTANNTNGTGRARIPLHLKQTQSSLMRTRDRSRSRSRKDLEDENDSKPSLGSNEIIMPPNSSTKGRIRGIPDGCDANNKYKNGTRGYKPIKNDNNPETNKSPKPSRLANNKRQETKEEDNVNKDKKIAKSQPSSTTVVNYYSPSSSALNNKNGEKHKQLLPFIKCRERVKEQRVKKEQSHQSPSQKIHKQEESRESETNKKDKKMDAKLLLQLRSGVVKNAIKKYDQLNSDGSETKINKVPIKKINNNQVTTKPKIQPKKQESESTREKLCDINKNSLVQRNKNLFLNLDPELEFTVPLEPDIEVVEGSPLELWVKVKGGNQVLVTWLKNDKPIPNAPPYFIHTSNPKEGIYSLRIKDIFIQDQGEYVCEAKTTRNKEKRCRCSSRVKVIEDSGDDRESLVSISSSSQGKFPSLSPRINNPPPKSLVIIPPIITITNHSDNSGILMESSQSEPEESQSSAEDRRYSYANAQNSSRDIYEDALEDIHEEVEESPMNSLSIVTEEDEDGDGSESLFTMSEDSVEVSGMLSDDKELSLSPKVLSGPGSLIFMLGETISLRVKFRVEEQEGEGEVEVGWCKLVRGNYEIITPNPNNSHFKILKPTKDLVMLEITNSTYEDSGKYRVKVSNSYGYDFHHCMVAVEGPPEPPPFPPTPIYDEISKTLRVCWNSCPFDGGSAITGYILEMKKKPSERESWVGVTDQGFKGLCYTLKDLNPSHTYYFRVCVENSYGKGKYSDVSLGVTIPASEISAASNTNTAYATELERKISTRSFSYEESPLVYSYFDVALKQMEFSQDYEKFEQLGKGRFGIVFKLLNKKTQNSYAGKFVKCRKSTDKERAELEYRIMNDLKYHPKLICLVDAYAMPREVVIVTELINGGELFERVVADDFTLTERDAVTFLRQICDGVSYIHEKNIMHLDLKPENILCTQKNSNQIKIIDFGLAQYYNPSEPIRVLFGTAEFVSPEIINYDTICPATDMWSVGVITYILLSGLSPFLGDDDNETFSNITIGEFDFDDEAFVKVSEDAKDFISNLILRRKEKRMTAQECLDHKWLALSDEEKKDIVLSTDKLKRFLLRRKWQKTGNAIRALGRITTLYSTARRSLNSKSSSTSSNNGSPPSLFPSLSTQESLEDYVFHDNPTTGEGNMMTNNGPQQRPKYNESCRSDSGIGGETT